MPLIKKDHSWAFFKKIMSSICINSISRRESCYAQFRDDLQAKNGINGLQTKGIILCLGMT